MFCIPHRWNSWNSWNSSLNQSGTLKLTNVALHFCCRHVTGDQSGKPGNITVRLLNDDHVVAHAIFVLEEKWRAAAFNVPLGHDGDPVTKNVRFVHEMSGEEDGPSFLLLLQQIPGEPASWRVHARCWLIQHYNLLTAVNSQWFDKVFNMEVYKVCNTKSRWRAR